MHERENQFDRQAGFIMALRSRMAQAVLLFLLTFTAAGCGADASDPESLIGTWTSSVDSLTFFANRSFFKEVKEENPVELGRTRTLQSARGKWEAEGSTLRLSGDQNSTANVPQILWSSGTYRWELKEGGKELHLKRSGDSQSLIYRKVK